MKAIKLIASLLLAASISTTTFAQSYIYLKDDVGMLHGIIRYEPSFVNKYIKTNIVCLSKKLEGIKCEYVADSSPVAKEPSQTLQVSVNTPSQNVDGLKRSIAELDGRVKKVEQRNSIPTTTSQLQQTQTSTEVQNSLSTTQVPIVTTPAATPTTLSKAQVVYQVIERAVPGPQGPAGRDGTNGRDGSSYSQPTLSLPAGAQFNGTNDPNTAVKGTAANFTDLSVSTLGGAGLSACNSSSDKLAYNASTKLFECGSDQVGSGGSLLAQTVTATSSITTPSLYASNTFATTSSVNNLLAGSATITNATVTNLSISGSISAPVFSGSSLSMTNATLTSASSTTFFANLLTALSAIFTNLTSTNATLTNATTTNLSVSATTTTTGLSAVFASITQAIIGTLWGTTGNFLTLNASTTNATTSNAVNFAATNATLTNATSTTLSVTNLLAGLTNGYVFRGSSANQSEATSTLFIANNGNVGIGTTSPSSALTVRGVGTFFSPAGSGNINLLLDAATTSNKQAQFLSEGIARWGIGISADLGGNTGGNFFFNRYNDSGVYQDTPLAIDRSSGTTTITKLSAVLQNGYVFRGSSGNRSEATSTLFIANNGNVGIGTTTPSSKLHVQGAVCLDLNSDGACTDNTSAISDERLKTNIATLTDSLSTVMKLRAAAFNWNNNNEFNVPVGSATSIGFIAQEVEKVLPGTDLVETTEAGYKILAYDKLVAVVVAAVQDIVGITGVFKANLVAWLASAENGIEEIVARVVSADRGEFKTLCVDGVCAGREQFLQVFGQGADGEPQPAANDTLVWIDPAASSTAASSTEPTTGTTTESSTTESPPATDPMTPVGTPAEPANDNQPPAANDNTVSAATGTDGQ